MLNVVVCVSGGGTNLQAILDAVESGKITNTRIAGVISNNAGAYALERAKAKNVPAVCISPKEYETREAFNRALLQGVDELKPDLIVLAGFLVNIPAEMVRREEETAEEQKGLFGRLFGHEKPKQAPQAGTDLELPTGEVLLGADALAKPDGEEPLDLDLTLRTADPGTDFPQPKAEVPAAPEKPAVPDRPAPQPAPENKPEPPKAPAAPAPQPEKPESPARGGRCA